MISKKLVFISHINEERELAKILSEEIKSSFLGLLDTFVSSDGESLPAGGRWLDSIDTALTNSAIQISLCSPQSIKRPWINFEAGASWIRRIPVVPLCHSGLSKSGLPIPLAMLQGADLDNADDLKVMFAELAKILGAAKTPTIDYCGLIDKCKIFIESYTYFNKVREAIYAACNAERQLEKLFFSGTIQSIPVSIQDYRFVHLAPALDTLKDLELVSYSFHGTRIGSDGLFRNGNITLTDKYFDEILPRIKQA
ncbi:toll/interleukin-1 receptor domain-containing protein [Acidithiobacillus sp.]|uniref:toll/interleukin-1 receptor domain-containing protein n=1 Tax=Acidithiobacillus sp. TaxID=1872118 RepID=UPI003D06D6C1